MSNASPPEAPPREPSPRKLQPLCDKIGRERVEHTLQAFYRRLLGDAQLRGWFAPLDLEAHVARIVEFWWIAMGGRSAAPPVFDMVGRHRPLGIGSADLEHWLELFALTVHEELPAELADQWLRMAEAIAAKMRPAVVRD